MVRRVVTGHDDEGRAVLLADGEPPVIIRSPLQEGLAFHEIWNTRSTPSRIGPSYEEPTHSHKGTAPPANGTVIRIVDLPPEGPSGPALDAEQTKKLFSAVGLEESARHHVPGRHPLMHRTESVDYGIVLFGEIFLLLDESEVHLRQGDIVVQRGTIHAWANRSTEICRMAFILTDATFEPELAGKLAHHDKRVSGAAEPGVVAVPAE